MPGPGGPVSRASVDAVVRLERVELGPAVREADCVVVCTDHSAYNWETLAREARLVVDTRNALRHVAAPRAEVVKL